MTAAGSAGSDLYVQYVHTSLHRLATLKNAFFENVTIPGLGHSRLRTAHAARKSSRSAPPSDMAASRMPPPSAGPGGRLFSPAAAAASASPAGSDLSRACPLTAAAMPARIYL